MQTRSSNHTWGYDLKLFEIFYGVEMMLIVMDGRRINKFLERQMNLWCTNVSFWLPYMERSMCSHFLINPFFGVLYIFVTSWCLIVNKSQCKHCRMLLNRINRHYIEVMTSTYMIEINSFHFIGLCWLDNNSSSAKINQSRWFNGAWNLFWCKKSFFFMIEHACSNHIGLLAIFVVL